MDQDKIEAYNKQCYWEEAIPGAGYTGCMGRWTHQRISKAFEPLGELGDLNHLDPEGYKLVARLWEMLEEAQRLAKQLSER